MKKRNKGVCHICQKEGNLIKKRYPSLISHEYCEDCFNNDLKKAQQASLLCFALTAGPIIIALIVDIIMSKVNGSTFGYITVGTWLVVGLLLSFTKYPSRIVGILINSIVLADITAFTFGFKTENYMDSALKWGFVLMIQIIFSFLATVYVICKSIVVFVNATLHKKNIDERIITIVYIATVLLSLFAMLCACLLIFE